MDGFDFKKWGNNQGVINGHGLSLLNDNGALKEFASRLSEEQKDELRSHLRTVKLLRRVKRRENKHS